MPLKPHLVLFLKEPWSGRVKTRLAADLGPGPAAGWYRRQSLALIRRLSRDPRFILWLAVTPDAAGLRSRVWPAGRRIPQGGGDLGARMGRVLRALPPGPAAILGSDIPGATPDRIWAAFRMLGSADAVFGPATDGGYWLVGLKRGRIPARLFEGVRWSTEHALADTIASLDGLGAAYADRLRDVDDLADLRAVSASDLPKPFGMNSRQT